MTKSVWRWHGVGKDCRCLDERSAGTGVVGEKSQPAKGGKREKVVKNLAVRAGYPANGRDKDKRKNGE